jgi:hypothetical protein
VVAEADVNGCEGCDWFQERADFLVIAGQTLSAGDIAIMNDGLGTVRGDFGDDFLEIFPWFKAAIFVVSVGGNVRVGNEGEVETVVSGAFACGVASGEAEGGRAQCSCSEKPPSIKRLEK